MGGITHLCHIAWLSREMMKFFLPTGDVKYTLSWGYTYSLASEWRALIHFTSAIRFVIHFSTSLTNATPCKAHVSVCIWHHEMVSSSRARTQGLFLRFCWECIKSIFQNALNSQWFNIWFYAAVHDISISALTVASLGTMSAFKWKVHICNDKIETFAILLYMFRFN